jgi:hypothetical protein
MYRSMRIALVLGAIVTLGTASAARAAHGGTVIVQVDGKLLSSSLTAAQAVARAQKYASFHLVVPRHTPPGVSLQDINVTTFGGATAFSTISLDYAGPGSKAFSLRESNLHVSTTSGGGTTSRVRVGKATGSLVETRKRGLHAIDLSWYATIGYDLVTLGSNTRLSGADLLAIARSL